MAQRKRRTPEQWEALIQQQEQSQLTQSQFCREHGLGYVSFSKWRQKLRKPNSDFLPLLPETTPESPRFTLTLGWGTFSLKMTL